MDLYKLMYNKQAYNATVTLALFPKLKAELESLINFNVMQKVLIIINQVPELDALSFLAHQLGEERVLPIDLSRVSSTCPSILLQNTPKTKLVDFASWNQRVFIRDNLAQIGKLVAIIDSCLYESDQTGCVFTRQQIKQLQTDNVAKVLYLQKPLIKLCEKETGFRALDFHRQYWGTESAEDMQYLELVRSYMCASRADGVLQSLTDESRSILDKAALALFKGKPVSKNTPALQSKRNVLAHQESTIQHAKSPKNLMFDVFRFHFAIYPTSVAHALISEALSDMAWSSNLQYYNFQPSTPFISVLTYVFQSLSYRRGSWDYKIYHDTPSVFINMSDSMAEGYDVPAALQCADKTIAQVRDKTYILDVDSEISEP